MKHPGILVPDLLRIGVIGQINPDRADGQEILQAYTNTELKLAEKIGKRIIQQIRSAYIRHKILFI